MSHRPRAMNVLWTFAVGGAERLVLDLVRCQRESPFEPLLAVLEPDGDLRGAAEAAGVELFTLRRGRLPQTAARFVALCRQARPDLLHAHNPAAGVYAAVAGRRLGIPVLVTSHGRGFVLNRGPLVRWVLRHWVNGFVAVSVEAARLAAEHLGRPVEQIPVILNGIDVAAFAGGPSDVLRRELGLSPQTWLFGTVARLDPVKEQERMLAATRLLLDQGRDVALAIAGDGPQRAFLTARLAELGLGGRAHLLGRRDDVPDLLRSLDCFCLSSRSEGLPISMLEAMAAGTPCVMTRVGGIAEKVTHEAQAVLVEPQDEVSLAAGLARLIDDPSLAERLSAAAQQMVRESYSIERMADDYGREYDRLLAGVQRRATPL